MARIAEYKGRTFEFPDTATDEDMMSFLATNAEEMLSQQPENEVTDGQENLLPEPPQDLTGQTTVEKPIDSSHWAPIPSQESSSNWAPTLEAGEGMRPGYRGDGTVNYDDPRWRGMDAYGISSQTAWDDTKNVLSSMFKGSEEAPDAYTNQAQANRDDVVRPLANFAPEQRGQEGMDVEALKAAYGDKPSVWDNANPETLAENVPQAPEEGATLLDAVYTEKARLMGQGMSDAEAEKAAFEKAQRDSLQMAASVAPIGLASLPARMAVAGALNTGAGAVADVAADKDLTKGQMAEDFFFGTLGGLGGGAGKSVAKKAVGEGADNLAVLQGTAIRELDDLAKQAKGKESVAASLSSTKPLSEALEGTKTITAADMVDAKNVASTLQTLNKAGAKTSVTDILKTVKNEELRSILSRAAPIKSTVDAANEKVAGVIGQDIGELLGLGGTTNKKANRAAVQEVAQNMTDSLAWSKESLDIVGNYQGATKQSFDKVFKSIEKTQQMVLDGRFAQAKRELAKTDNKKAAFTKAYGSTTAGEIQRLKKEMLALIEVGQSTIGASQPQNLLGKIQAMGVPTLAAYAHNPLIGAGVSAGKSVAKFAANKVNTKKLADIEKALGGKLKFDKEAERMLAQGSDMGDVVGYLVAKMLRED